MSAYQKAGESDEWYTPKYIFDAIGETFDLDVAAPPGGPELVPCKRWFTKEDNGLTSEWEGFVWMNAPFGHQRHKMAWLSKFFEHGNGIALVPDRTSAPWFQKFAPMADCICWVAPKVKFIRPDGSFGGSPGNGTALLASGARASIALSKCNLGMMTAKWNF